MKKIFISTSSFAKFDSRPVDLLKKAGLSFELNPYGRRLEREEIVNLIYPAEGLIAGTEPLDAQTLKSLSNLRVISRCGSGLDNVDLKAAARLGIKVFNTPESPALAVAELTLGLMLALLRKITSMDRQMRAGIWSKSMGNLLYGKRVGIVGLGRIGRKVAQLLGAFGSEIFYYDPYVDEKEIPGLRRLELKQALATCDIISLHIPYSRENINLLSENELSMMKQGAFLINCSRGGIVDERALYSAIKEGRLGGAAIDVFEKEPYSGPLRELDNVILTPHIGAYAKEARVAMEIEAVKNLLKGLEK